MKKSILLSAALLIGVTISKAQTARQFSGLDCSNNSVDLFADLDAGKAVVIFFYMPNCGSCPPPAQKIQTMANNINALYPGMVKGYAFPYNNTTTCAVSTAWTTSSSVDQFYTAMDSGATMVAYYGGFGMPTVVLVGGLDHRTMFSTLSFSTSDTTIMRDSIMALYSQLNGVNQISSVVSRFAVFPNPATDMININVDLNETTDLLIDIADITGKQVALVMDEKSSGIVSKQFDTNSLANGSYLVRLTINGKTTTRKLTVNH